MTTTDCAGIRQAIHSRNFVGWTGLSSDCSASDLFDDLPENIEQRPKRPLGEDFEPAHFVLLDLPGYYRPMVSFRDSALVLFDGMNPELDWTPLGADLQTPAAQFDWYYGTLKIHGGEWIYPKRGITVFLNTQRDTVLHIALYHATTAKRYIQMLRPPLRKTMRP